MKEEHLKLLKEMYVGWNECEFGAPEIDPKRPYGDSDVYEDMNKILGLPMKSCPHCGEVIEEKDSKLLEKGVKDLKNIADKFTRQCYWIEPSPQNEKAVELLEDNKRHNDLVESLNKMKKFTSWRERKL